MVAGITKDELIHHGCFHISKITEGLERYPSEILEGSSEHIKRFIEKAMGENETAAYADFYYYTLNGEDRQRFTAGLNEAELCRLKDFVPSDSAIFYPLCKDNLDFFADITARELLFSSFYFGVKKAILWGNYQLKYPIFCQDQETLAYYLALAQQNNLTIGG